MLQTSRAFAILIMMVCMTSVFAIPKEQTLGYVISKNLESYKNKSI
jgi:hypothetical protein